ncbi:MAG: type II toxin-antitoxin system RelE/ParE family toxin [Phycisphaerales bacterium]
MDDLLRRLEGLAEFPEAQAHAYESHPRRPLRHLIAPPLRAVYEIRGGHIVVLAVRHTRRGLIWVS